MWLHWKRAVSGGLVAMTLGIGCEESEARFTTRFASDFAPADRAISVLGLYRDGAMSPEGWEGLAPYLGGVLGTAACPVGFAALLASEAPLAAAVDEVTRDEGPTDDVLGEIAAAAKGDLILVVTRAGSLPHKVSRDGGGETSPAAARAPPTGSRGGGMRGMGRMGGPPLQSPPRDTNELDLSVVLFSKSEKRSVASVSLQYTGSSVEDAIAKLAAQLAQVLPRARCEGWLSDAKIDPERVRHAGQP